MVLWFKIHFLLWLPTLIDVRISASKLLTENHISTIPKLLNTNDFKDSICLSGSIDAITSLNGDIFIFKKSNYWKVTKMQAPTEENAALTGSHLDSEWFHRMSDDGRLDAVATDNYNIEIQEQDVSAAVSILFRGHQFTFLDHSWGIPFGTKVTTDLSKNSTFRLTHVDAATFVAFNKVAYVYIFQDDLLWKFHYAHFQFMLEKSYPINVTLIDSKFPVKIDASFSDHKYIYLFKHIYYYRIKLIKFPIHVTRRDLKPKIAFLDMFGCTKSFYKNIGFESYEGFLSLVYQLNEFSNTRKEKRDKARNKQISNQIKSTKRNTEESNDINRIQTSTSNDLKAKAGDDYRLSELCDVCLRTCSKWNQVL